MYIFIPNCYSIDVAAYARESLDEYEYVVQCSIYHIYVNVKLVAGLHNRGVRTKQHYYYTYLAMPIITGRFFCVSNFWCWFRSIFSMHRFVRPVIGVNIVATVFRLLLYVLLLLRIFISIFFCISSILF